ncbi:hypothetical protein [Streptomyces sp. NPDC048496]|uniref:hypothetical protein n=1 Tax=Streptomyces sp. NPDC048496 TaxID=3365558 RepID=UPI003715E3ED
MPEPECLARGLVFAVCATLGPIAAPMASGTDRLNWIIPVALLVPAVRFTRCYPEYVKQRAATARVGV